MKDYLIKCEGRHTDLFPGSVPAFLSTSSQPSSSWPASSSAPVRPMATHLTLPSGDDQRALLAMSDAAWGPSGGPSAPAVSVCVPPREAAAAGARPVVVQHPPTMATQLPLPLPNTMGLNMHALVMQQQQHAVAQRAPTLMTTLSQTHMHPGFSQTALPLGGVATGPPPPPYMSSGYAAGQHPYLLPGYDASGLMCADLARLGLGNMPGEGLPYYAGLAAPPAWPGQPYADLEHSAAQGQAGGAGQAHVPLQPGDPGSSSGSGLPMHAQPQEGEGGWMQQAVAGSSGGQVAPSGILYQEPQKVPSYLGSPGVDSASLLSHSTYNITAEGLATTTNTTAQASRGLDQQASMAAQQQQQPSQLGAASRALAPRPGAVQHVDILTLEDMPPPLSAQLQTLPVGTASANAATSPSSSQQPQQQTQGSQGEARGGYGGTEVIRQDRRPRQARRPAASDRQGAGRENKQGAGREGRSSQAGARPGRPNRYDDDHAAADAPHPHHTRSRSAHRLHSATRRHEGWDGGGA